MIGPRLSYRSVWTLHRAHHPLRISRAACGRSARGLYDERHVFLAGQLHLLPLPQRVVYRERVDGHRQVFRVHLGETLAARVVSESKQELFKIYFCTEIIIHKFSLQQWRNLSYSERFLSSVVSTWLYIGISLMIRFWWNIFSECKYLKHCIHTWIFIAANKLNT